MYNFYIYLIILAIISPFAAYNRSKILQKIKVQNEIVFISSAILIIYIIFQIVNKTEIIPKNMNNDTIKYLIINSILASISLYLGGMILTKEKVFKFKALQKPVYLIILVIIGCCFYKESFNYKIIIGIILLIIGSYLIDTNMNLKNILIIK